MYFSDTYQVLVLVAEGSGTYEPSWTQLTDPFLTYAEVLVIVRKLRIAWRVLRWSEDGKATEVTVRLR